MEMSDYLLTLGKLVANLHSLEFALRAFLLKNFESHEPAVDLESVVAGDEVALNSFTNYDPLNRVIVRYNEVVRPIYPNCCVDETVVEVRDMIAHGRIAGKDPKPPFELIKFGKPNKMDMVPVEHVVIVDLHWLSSNVKLVLDQIRKVIKASNQLGQNILEYD
jgi:hypothetical protein